MEVRISRFVSNAVANHFTVNIWISTIAPASAALGLRRAARLYVQRWPITSRARGTQDARWQQKLSLLLFCRLQTQLRLRFHAERESRRPHPTSASEGEYVCESGSLGYPSTSFAGGLHCWWGSALRVALPVHHWGAWRWFTARTEAQALLRCWRGWSWRQSRSPCRSQAIKERERRQRCSIAATRSRCHDTPTEPQVTRNNRFHDSTTHDCLLCITEQHRCGSWSPVVDSETAAVCTFFIASSSMMTSKSSRPVSYVQWERFFAPGMRSCTVCPGSSMSRPSYLYPWRYYAYVLAQHLWILDEHTYALWQVVPHYIRDAVCDRLVQELHITVGLGRTRCPHRLRLPALCGGGAWVGVGWVEDGTVSECVDVRAGLGAARSSGGWVNRYCRPCPVGYGVVALSTNAVFSST